MTVLVVGADRVDAGKTTFSAGLVSYCDGVGFKPRAGNDYWFDYDDCVHAVRDGRLFGKDARTLKKASDSAIEIESLNPIHRLWQPAPSGSGLLGPSDREFVLDRYGNGKFVVNAEADVPEKVTDSLSLAGAPRVGSVEELNQVTRTKYLPLFEELRRLIDETQGAIVESYGDVARPIQDLQVARVAVVEPGRVRVYDGSRYMKACEIASGSPVDGELEERVGDVVEVLEPLESISLSPLPSEVREDPEKIAGVYEEVYSVLV